MQPQSPSLLVRLVRAVCCLALLALAGCAASYQPMGPVVQSGRIAGDALVAADGARLPLRAWLPAGPPRAVVIALHGMNDYSFAFEMPGGHWAAAGIATYAYDQRGFGESARPGIWPGTATLVADLEAAVEAVGARHPGLPLYLVGESMGGAVVLTALTSPPVPGRPPLAHRVHGAVLSAPALWGRQTMNPLFRLSLWAGRMLLPGLMVRPPAQLEIQPSDNLAMLRALGRDPLVQKRTRLDAVAGVVDLMSTAHERLAALPPAPPVLALYGMHEQVLARRSVTDATARLAEGPATTRVAIYERGYHLLLRDLCAPRVWDDVLAWMHDPAAPLPSGADAVTWQEREPDVAHEAEPPPGCLAATPAAAPPDGVPELNPAPGVIPAD